MLRLTTPILSALLLLSACSKGDDTAPIRPVGKGHCASYDELRQPFFGDTHVHTDRSLDANTQGTRLSQADAYAFARGATIGIQPYDEDGNALRSLTLEAPLDFVLLADHAEYLGTIRTCEDPARPGYDHPDCQVFREDPETAFLFLNFNLGLPEDQVAYPDLCGEGGELCLEAGKEVWEEIRRDAEAAYDRTTSCEFTTFIGYEWSPGPGTLNLHRNVLFANDRVPDSAVSYFDEPYVEGLWRELRAGCLDRDDGCDVLAIPHNSNVSGGRMFEDVMEDGSPFDEAYVAERNAMEPLIEIYQHKGDSECLPGDLLGDELCGFEKIPANNLFDTITGLFSTPIPSDFVRSALGEGMRFERELGSNPFQYGVTAATDTHIAAPGAVSESDFPGHGGAGQANRTLPEGLSDTTYVSPGGIGGVWAEENSREAIFEAMRRRESFGTSGPRIVPRFFGGWSYPDELCQSPELAAVGYEQGVPMGGALELPTDANASAAPRFVVMAKQDPSGAPLQRIQIVKGWLDGEQHRTRVYDVAGEPDNGASVSLETCEPSGPGAAELCEVWEDPDFESSQDAYYYVRALENPTCRWSTRQCVEAGYDCTDPQTPMDEACCDPSAGLNTSLCEGVDCADPDSLPPVDARCCVPRAEPVIQERAWTSPIWYRAP